MRAVDNIRAAGIGHYQFSTVLMRDNLAELDLAA